MRKSDSKNKFDSLTRDELLRAVLELEDENAKLRPKAAKFKLGQLVAYGNKNPWVQGQPAFFFTVLSTENRYGDWYYGYAKNGSHGFHVYPEDKLRFVTTAELEGTLAPASPEASHAAPAVTMAQLIQDAHIAPVSLDIETDAVDF